MQENNNKEEIGKSLNGQPIYQYNLSPNTQFGKIERSHVENVAQHIEKHLGPILHILPEVSQKDFKINLIIVPPTKTMPYIKIVTSGMSDKEMCILNGEEHLEPERYIELMMLLPPTWQLDGKSLGEQKWIWPLDLLSFLSWFPHAYNTRLGFGHTVSNGEKAIPYASNTRLNHSILLQSISAPTDFHTLEINENKTIHFLTVYPLYEEETQYKLDYGTPSLLEKFNQYNISDVINPKRRNVMKKRFFLF